MGAFLLFASVSDKMHALNFQCLLCYIVFEFDEYFRFMCNQYILMEVLHEHYERLGTAAVDEQFDDSWKEHIEEKVTV